ncbi:hypothetical protein SLE2022_090930 [Rubroshorea leprosula]
MDSDFMSLILALLQLMFSCLVFLKERMHGTMGTCGLFLEAFKSQNPETFIYNLVSRYGRTGIYKTHIFWSPGVIVFTAEICKKVLADGFAFHKAIKARNTLENIPQSVLDEKKARRKSDIDPEEKRTVMDMLMEIEDETGQIMWATIYLHDNPEMLQKAKEEQEEIFKRRPSMQKGLTFQEIRQMEYLSKVFDETMRMASLFLCIFRKAKVDVNINGFVVWNRGLHMDPENYPSPQVFSPSSRDNQRPKAGSFIPFGARTRICPGADLAKLQTFIFLHYFLLNYKLERVNPRGPTQYFRTPSPADNCLAKVTRLP